MVVARHERRDDDGALGRHRLDVLERHVADELGFGEVAGGGQPLAELPRGAARELLHPAHPEPERLAEDPVVAAALARRGGRDVERDRLFRQDRRLGHLRSGERQHGRAADEDLLVVEPVLARLGQDPQRHRGARHPVAAGVGEHADEDLVGVERAAGWRGCDAARRSAAGSSARRAPEPPRDRRPCGRGGARPGAAAPSGASRPARRPAGGGRRGSGSAG